MPGSPVRTYQTRLLIAKNVAKNHDIHRTEPVRGSAAAATKKKGKKEQGAG